MKYRRNRLPVGIAVMLVTLLVASFGVAAAVKYLAPQKVAEEFQDAALAKAFQTEDAILVNETQECAGYRITLLGIVSGEDLSEHTSWDEQGNIMSDRTYVITAIENADGTPRPDVSDEAYGEDLFFVSPYIKGLSMIEYNAYMLGGGYSEDVIDGIQYRIMECDNIEIFAHRGLYLGISDGISYNKGAFIMDETTGEITRNEAYEGVNALFTLPISKEKGDEAAVEAYLQEKADAQNAEASGESEEVSPLEKTAQKMEAWTLEDFQANAKCVFEEELIPDEKGFVSYDYSFPNGGGGEGETLVDLMFSEPEPGLSDWRTIYGDSPTYIETFELLESGNIVLRVFAFHGE